MDLENNLIHMRKNWDQSLLIEQKFVHINDMNEYTIFSAHPYSNHDHNLVQAGKVVKLQTHIFTSKRKELDLLPILECDWGNSRICGKKPMI